MAADRKASVFYPITDGTLTFNFPFLYLKKEFVKASYIDDEGITHLLVYEADYTVRDSTLTLFAPLPVGVTFSIFRQTPTDQMVQWVDASILRAYDMNKQEIQMLHILEEHHDSLYTEALCRNERNLWDALGRRIINVGDPIDPQDVINKRWFESESANYLQQITAIKDEALRQAIASAKSAAEAAESFNRITELYNKILKETQLSSQNILESQRLRDETAELAQRAENAASGVLSLSSELYDPNKMYNPPATVVAPDGHTYRCVQTSQGEDPATSIKWVEVAVVLSETFEYDEQGDLMPRYNPRMSQKWRIDDNGNIMPNQ